MEVCLMFILLFVGGFFFSFVPIFSAFFPSFYVLPEENMIMVSLKKPLKTKLDVVVTHNSEIFEIFSWCQIVWKY